MGLFDKWIEQCPISPLKEYRQWRDQFSFEDFQKILNDEDHVLTPFQIVMSWGFSVPSEELYSLLKEMLLDGGNPDMWNADGMNTIHYIIFCIFFTPHTVFYIEMFILILMRYPIDVNRVCFLGDLELAPIDLFTYLQNKIFLKQRTILHHYLNIDHFHTMEPLVFRQCIIVLHCFGGCSWVYKTRLITNVHRMQWRDIERYMEYPLIREYANYMYKFPSEDIVSTIQLIFTIEDHFPDFDWKEIIREILHMTTSTTDDHFFSADMTERTQFSKYTDIQSIDGLSFLVSELYYIIQRRQNPYSRKEITRDVLSKLWDDAFDNYPFHFFKSREWSEVFPPSSKYLFPRTTELTRWNVHLNEQRLSYIQAKVEYIHPYNHFHAIPHMEPWEIDWFTHVCSTQYKLDLFCNISAKKVMDVLWSYVRLDKMYMHILYHALENSWKTISMYRQILQKPVVNPLIDMEYIRNRHNFWLQKIKKE